MSQAIAMGRKAYQMIETIAIDPEVGSIYKVRSFPLSRSVPL